ncbi:MAG: acyl-CoA carboxylase subunit epsilon [Ilumatobacteraceae bacterium]
MSPDAGSEAVISAPILRIVKGDLTVEELAALVAVVAARNAAAAQSAAGPRSRVRSQWNHPARLVRAPYRPGPDQWRRSTFGG